MGKLFEKGNAGRPKGTANKSSEKVKQAYAQLLENNLEKMQADIDALKPMERLHYLLSLSEYILPKLARTEADITSNGETIGLSEEQLDKTIDDLLRKIATARESATDS
jgi:hypothetical protein